MKNYYRPTRRWRAIVAITFLSLISAASALAAEFTVNGINYNQYKYYDKENDTMVKGVSIAKYDTGNEYSGDIVIPDKITVDGVDYSVIEIEESAFESCVNLTSIKLPDNIYSISNKAFYKCSKLVELSLPKSLNSIGNDAFYQCTGLTDLTLPESLTAIGERAFRGCSGVTKLYLPQSLTSIGISAFYDCTGITELSLPQSLTSIDNDTFCGCSGITELTLPQSLISIGKNAFQGCSGLTKLDLPESLVTIGEEAFIGCTKIKSLTLPAKLETIGRKAFNNTFTEVTSLNPTPPTISNNSFASSTKLIVNDADIYRNDANWSALFKYIVEPSIEANGIIYAISSKTNHTCRIEKLNAQNVSTFTIPASIDIDGVNYTIDSYSDEALSNITGVETLIIPGTLTAIPGAIFKNLTRLKTLTLEDSETEIDLGDSEGYANCPLETVYIGRNITYSSISSSSYTPFNAYTRSNNGTYTLSKVTFGPNATKINNYEFYGCSGLLSVERSNNIESIGIGAFSSCESLTSFDASSAKVIGESAFSGCGNLKAIDLGNSIIELGHEVFYNCTSLTDITLPSSLTSIGIYTFYNCKSITSITIPANVKTIGNYAFRHCKNLSEVKSLATTPPKIGECEPFDNTPVYKLEVFDADAYRNDAYWKLVSSHIVEPSKEVNGTEYGITSKANKTCSIEKLKNINAKSYRLPEATGSIEIDGEKYNITSYSYKFMSENSQIEEIIVPKSYTSLQGKFLEELTNLKKIIIEDSEIELDCGAAIDYANYSLESLYLGRNITYAIDYDAACRSPFYEKERLTNVELSSNVTKLGDYMFLSTGISNITGGKNIISIGDYAFAGCTNLMEINAPSTQSIGYAAFQYCSNLVSATFGDTLSEIGDYAFLQCTKLSGLFTISAEIKTIPYYAFWLTNIKAIEIKGTNYVEFTSGLNSAMRNLTTLIVSSSMADTYRSSDWGNYYDIVSNSGLEVSVNVTTPGNLAKDIANQTRKAPASVNKLTITGGKINQDDFNVMKSNMTACFDIDLSAADCSEIVDEAFNGKTILKNIVLPIGATSIGASAFANCPILESVTGTDNLTKIGDKAFYGCESLKTAIIGNNVTEIGVSAFYGAYKLKDFAFPSALTTIKDGAFYNCCSLSEINLPPDISSIGSGTFINTSIKHLDFSKLENITSITSAMFYRCSKLQSIVLPKRITSISSDAFSSCTSLPTINLSETSVKTIGDNAFEGCTALTSVYLPSTIAEVGDEAFSGCRNISLISVPTATPPTAYTSTFKNVANEACSLVIPTDAFADYLSAQYWGSFIDMKSSFDISIEGDGVEVAYEVFDSEEEAEAGTNTARRIKRAASKAETSNTLADGSSLFVSAKKAVRIQLIEDDENEVAQVSLNDTDVTDRIDNGYLIFSNFADINALKVSTRQRTATGITDAIASSEITDDSIVDVYNLSGIQVLHGVLMSSITNLTPGIYIVRTATVARKIAIK